MNLVHLPTALPALTEHYLRTRQITQEVLDSAKWFKEDNLYDAINNEQDWRRQLQLFRLSYQICDRLYTEGLFDWMQADPYFLADFDKVFTPIEEQMWHEIRANGLRLWPQLPVGRFYVDFGNPVLKIAVECDGKAFHDIEKDALRDAELRRMGWTIYRADGATCNRILPEPELHDFDSEEAWESALHKWEQCTLGGIVKAVRARVLEYEGCHAAHQYDDDI